MSYCSQTFSVDFLQIILKFRHFKNLKNFVKTKKFNIMMKFLFIIILNLCLKLIDTFLLRNMFLSIQLVYCRIFVTFFAIVIS